MPKSENDKGGVWAFVRGLIPHIHPKGATIYEAHPVIEAVPGRENLVDGVEGAQEYYILGSSGATYKVLTHPGSHAFNSTDVLVGRIVTNKDAVKSEQHE